MMHGVCIVKTLNPSSAYVSQPYKARGSLLFLRINFYVSMYVEQWKIKEVVDRMVASIVLCAPRSIAVPRRQLLHHAS